MKDQNPKPKSARKIQRIVFPRSPETARARAVRIFGMSRCAVDGSASTTELLTLARSPGTNCRSARFAPADGSRSKSNGSGVEDIDQGPRGVLAGESQENLLQPFGSGLRARSQLRHRAKRANHAGL